VNTTEERLHDALRAAGETIESVPAFVVPASRFTLRRIAAFVSVAVVIIGGVAFWSGSGGRQPLSSPVQASPVNGIGDVVVFLCGTKSSNPDCAHRKATAGERGRIMTMLRRLPQVKSVDYENHEMAYAKFRQNFANNPEFVATVKEDDMPESLTVRLTESHNSRPVVQAISGLPGIDQIMDEPAGFRNAP
jgi:cell division transport system permease protein